MRRKWLVAYQSPGNTGRIFLTTDDVPLSESLFLDMEQAVQRDTGFERAFIYNVLPLEQVDCAPSKERS